MFHLWLFGWFVSRITQKAQKRCPWNLDGGRVVAPELVWILGTDLVEKKKKEKKNESGLFMWLVPRSEYTDSDSLGRGTECALLSALLVFICRHLKTSWGGHGINFHIHADDTRLYISMSPDDSGPRDALLNCILDIFSPYCIDFEVHVEICLLFSAHFNARSHFETASKHLYLNNKVIRENTGYDI